jgi:3-hydroxyisobutyrate dehydrogenase
MNSANPGALSMTRVAFIGLGNMGSGMAANQVKAGREVVAFDLSADAMARAKEQGMSGAASAAEAVKDANIVITMLPAGEHVRDVYDQAILPNAPKDALLLDCSTIDVDSARTVARDASMQGFRAADAPVSGGAAAASGGTLTFMIGCREQDYADMEEALKPMAKAIIRAGDAGAGQAAKICNNMLLGISMIATCEAFVLAERLGLDAQPMLVAHIVLPLAWPSAGSTLKPRLRGRVRRRDDAKGPSSRAGRGDGFGRRHAARRRRPGALCGTR